MKVKNIEIVHKGEDYIKVIYRRGDKEFETEVSGIDAEIIETLCFALAKKFPEGYQFYK